MTEAKGKPHRSKHERRALPSSVAHQNVNKGVLFTLAGLFLYAIIIQFTDGSNKNPFQLLNLHPESFDANTGINVKYDGVGKRQQQYQNTRRMSLPSGDNNDNTPIEPHNKICRDYLKAFLNGTTDSKDECQGLGNAYEHADCTDEINGNSNQKNLFSTTTTTSPRMDKDMDLEISQDKNSTDDTDDRPAPAIDDFFEEFECCKVISHYYSSRCLYHQQFASLSLLGIVAVLILCNLVKSLLKIYGIQWLPEAGGCVLVGAAMGVLLTLQLPNYQMNLGTFNDDLFLFILLPPIIFHASLSIDKGRFRFYIFPIMMFAVVGTIISAVITGLSVHYLTQITNLTSTIPILDSMIFGALISSIDPVAVLSIMHSMGVSEIDVLYVLVFGESILNDGVSIAMFESLTMHLHADQSSMSTSLDKALIWSSAKYFWKVSWVSILVGVLTGITCTIYFWALRGRHGPVAEVASFFCFAMLAYYVSDGLDASGIVSIMVAGIMMDVYVRGSHLSEGDTSREFQTPMQAQTQTQRTVYVPANQGQGLEASQTSEAGYPLPSAPRCPSYTDCRVMFSGVGHISDRAKIHVGFVADVLANLMETAIFAYLGLFLFSNKKWDDFPLILVGVFSCVISRAVMIGSVSTIVNVGGWFHERIMGKVWNYDSSDPMPLESQQPRLHIDRNMQLVLLFAGMRGAVSLALAENIPLYDVVTKQGSQHKAALKAMTSSSIIFTVFVFGASTYYTLKQQRDAQQNNELDGNGGVGNGGSLMTSLLNTHSLELREDHDRTSPPWMDQNQNQNDVGTSDHNPAVQTLDERPETTFV